MIRKSGSKFVVLSKDGTRRLGTYRSRDAAQKRIRQVEYWKHLVHRPRGTSA